MVSIHHDLLFFFLQILVFLHSYPKKIVVVFSYIYNNFLHYVFINNCSFTHFGSILTSYFPSTFAESLVSFKCMQFSSVPRSWICYLVPSPTYVCLGLFFWIWNCQVSSNVFPWFSFVLSFINHFTILSLKSLKLFKRDK